MGSLAYKSNRLGFRTNKLGFRNPWSNLDMVNPQYKSGSYEWMSGGYGFTIDTNYMTGWDYSGQYSVIDRALDAFDGAGWTNGDPSARIQAAHSHGANSPYAQRYSNYFAYQEGATLFIKPSGVQSVTEAKLWIGNAGEIFHTIQNVGTSVWVNAYDGLFINDCGYPENYLPYLNNTWLEIVISVSSSVFYKIMLTRGDLATLNSQQGNGKVAAGLGPYSYMYSNSIYLNMPAQVIAMLNNYNGVAVDAYWNWNDAILGPACLSCLHLTNCRSAGYPHPQYSVSYEEKNLGSATPWAVRTAFARILKMEAR